ncbi:MAG: hypothetical protein RSE58_12225 [Clostridia bacterium]
MSFIASESQPLRLAHSFSIQRLRTQKFVESSWAKGFAEFVEGKDVLS